MKFSKSLFNLLNLNYLNSSSSKQVKFFNKEILKSNISKRHGINLKYKVLNEVMRQEPRVIFHTRRRIGFVLIQVQLRPNSSLCGVDERFHIPVVLSRACYVLQTGFNKLVRSAHAPSSYWPHQFRCQVLCTGYVHTRLGNI